MLLDTVLQEIKSKKTLTTIIFKSCNEWEIVNLSGFRDTIISQDSFGQMLFTSLLSNRFRLQDGLLIVVVSQCCVYPVMLFCNVNYLL